MPQWLQMEKSSPVDNKSISGQLQWWQAAEILGVSCRTMRRRPLRGMRLSVDGSTHAWIPALAPSQFDRVAVVEDADTDCYDAPRVEPESTRTVMAGLHETLAEHGLFCSLYTDRGSHFFHTPKAGGPES